MNQPPGTVQMKVFCMEQAQASGCRTITAIFNRIARGNYPGLVIHRIAPHLVFVDPSTAHYKRNQRGARSLPQYAGLTDREYHRLQTRAWRAKRKRIAESGK
jgi:hypothetical protein